MNDCALAFNSGGGVETPPLLPIQLFAWFSTSSSSSSSFRSKCKAIKFFCSCRSSNVFGSSNNSNSFDHPLTVSKLSLILLFLAVVGVDCLLLSALISCISNSAFIAETQYTLICAAIVSRFDPTSTLNRSMTSSTT